MNVTIQDPKTELEAMKKIQTEGILEMKNLRIQTGTSEASFTNRIEERISGVEDTVEEMDTSIKKKKKPDKSKNS